MAQFKSCPSCGAEVPRSAARCKDCFYDFTADKKRNYGPLLLLGSLAGMTVVASIVFALLAFMPTDQLILVDQETQSIVITTKYRSGPSTERIAFGDVVKLEHVSESGSFEIIAITTDAERKVLMTSNGAPLYTEAEKYAQMMKKPLERTGTDESLKEQTPN